MPQNTANIAFITDSFHSNSPENATTMVLIREALKSGADVFWMEAADLHVQNNNPVAYMAQVHFLPNSDTDFLLGKSFVASLNSLDQIWWRKTVLSSSDSEVALAVLQLVSDQVKLVNEPGTLKAMNEHLFALQFPELTPESLVTQKVQAIKAFLSEHGPNALLQAFDKPLHHQHFLLNQDDPNLEALLIEATRNENKHVLIQKWNQEQSQRTKRFYLLDGDLLEVVEQKAETPCIRASLERNASLQLTNATENELLIVGRFGTILRDKGIAIATLDMCDEKVLSMNFSCPLGLEYLQELVPNFSLAQLFLNEEG